ncbi:MAG: SDR family NAD(P)-dependent oxidoreductase, partial [Firmicutes bacterium]|nr:SDR family NAD(P)-dependent oxidoreductase [Bacillota bacterium]
MGRIRVDLGGKVALVTGAGKGLGRAASLALAESGASVAAVSRTASDLESLSREIAALGGECFTRTCDVRNVAEVYRMVEEVHAWKG